jgi:hypothetical protein
MKEKHEMNIKSDLIVLVSTRGVFIHVSHVKRLSQIHLLHECKRKLDTELRGREQGSGRNYHKQGGTYICHIHWNCNITSISLYREEKHWHFQYVNVTFSGGCKLPIITKLAYFLALLL